MEGSDIRRLPLLGELGVLVDFVKEVVEECGTIEVNEFKHFI